MINPDDFGIKKPDKNLIKLMDKNELDEKIIYNIESDFHSIKVVENKIGRFLKYQDTYQAGFIKSKNYTGNLFYINYFLIPYLMNKNIKDILFIGFGSGIIINQYLDLFEKLKNIDAIDIEENIFNIARKYFNFKDNEKISLNLQDAIIYLKNKKKKYDLIVVDVANNEGIDERFIDESYLELVKKHLKKDGIFISNLPSSFDIFNKKNKLILNTLDKYKKYFKNIDIYNGKTSSSLFYQVFYNINEIVYDVTNLILISSDKKYKIDYNYKDEKLDKIIDLKPYLKDLVEK